MTRTDLIALAGAVEAGAATDFRAMLTDGDPPAERAKRCGWAASAYRGNLNAALALHKALLPEWLLPCIVSHYLNGEDGVTVELYQRTGNGEAMATDNNIARAWLLAVLRAKVAAAEGVCE